MYVNAVNAAKLFYVFKNYPLYVYTVIQCLHCLLKCAHITIMYMLNTHLYGKGEFKPNTRSRGEGQLALEITVEYV